MKNTKAPGVEIIYNRITFKNQNAKNIFLIIKN